MSDPLYVFGYFPPEVIQNLTREACNHLGHKHNRKSLRALCRSFMEHHPIPAKTMHKSACDAYDSLGSACSESQQSSTGCLHEVQT